MKKNLLGVVAAFASDRSPLNQPEAEAVCGGALRSNLVNKTVNKMVNNIVNKMVDKRVNKMVNNIVDTMVNKMVNMWSKDGRQDG